MYRLALFLSHVLLASAKISQVPDFWYLENFNEVVEPDLINVEHREPSKDLWILSLNNVGLDSLRLRLGSSAEEQDFDESFGPMIERYESRHLTSKPPQRAKLESQTMNENALKEEIMRIVNKFVLSANVDPEIHLPDSVDDDNTPSVTLYFKNRFTSFTVKFGEKQWNYFVAPPSPLPNWFYKEFQNIQYSDQETYIEIPKDVEKEFYVSVCDMLLKFLGHPV